MQFSESKGPGGARNERKKPQLKAEYATLSKDGKSVWEPGLPAEVTSRRVHKPVRNAPVEEASIKCDLRHTLHMTPAARAEWLDKAMQAIPTGRAKVQEVFNIVTHPKFVSGVPDKVGRRMLRIVAGALDNFSDKQRITLVSKCKLAELYQSAAMLAEGEDDDGDADEELAGAGLEGDAAEEEPAASRSRSRRSLLPQGPPALAVAQAEGRGRRPRAPVARAFPGAGGEAPAAARGREGGAPPRAAARARGEAAAPGEGGEPDMSPAERAGLEQALAARQRQQEEERRKLDEDRRAYEDKERQRKARLGSAFLMADEDQRRRTTRTHWRRP
ncbi:unnamed protein product [Prorocentrum cordatum]|uniref:Uncharacterized protein n=1 Tax=Prorocentrum cordatum TaxID=2364126 RepID=A0ABN9Q075_9DINO|nr:unnamed protein product [Polarella glacialis]